MSSAGKNEGISGMGHSSSLTSMSSAGLGGRVVTERGLGIMAVVGALSRWSSFCRFQLGRRYRFYACRAAAVKWSVGQWSKPNMRLVLAARIGRVSP